MGSCSCVFCSVMIRVSTLLRAPCAFMFSRTLATPFFTFGEPDWERDCVSVGCASTSAAPDDCAASGLPASSGSLCFAASFLARAMRSSTKAWGSSGFAMRRVWRMSWNILTRSCSSRYDAAFCAMASFSAGSPRASAAAPMSTAGRCSSEAARWDKFTLTPLPKSTSNLSTAASKFTSCRGAAGTRSSTFSGSGSAGEPGKRKGWPTFAAGAWRLVSPNLIDSTAPSGTFSLPSSTTSMAHYL
mmetsp:Transcript_98061/g.211449  ORF Transcript_98061/g.211449 Transcript_98061/m.211449 type:complete len:244 (+) Transcript_98061:2795-3526(+)